MKIRVMKVGDGYVPQHKIFFWWVDFQESIGRRSRHYTSVRRDTLDFAIDFAKKRQLEHNQCEARVKSLKICKVVWREHETKHL